MPPKTRTTKADILQAGLRMIQEHGADSINARALASYMHCSTQPIFSNFNSMEELKAELIYVASERYRAFTEKEQILGHYPEYKASGMAYIKFAKEEKELFKFLFMRDRTDEINDCQEEYFTDKVYFLRQTFHTTYEKANLFHMEMWAFVHGIATMLATSYLDLEWEDISTMLTNAFLGFKKSHHIEEEQPNE